MTHQRDKIDAASRAPLEELLKAMPGGFNAIADIEQRRATVEALMEQMAAEVPPNENVTFEDRMVPGPKGAPEVKVRIYHPVDSSEDSLPGLYYIHGGGMVLGSVELSHLETTTLCDALGAVVVSVDYRLAPEHPHPAPAEDCYAGLVWMAEHADELGIDRDRIAIYGPSAGGGLTIATTLMARDRGGPKLCFMAPIYPMIDDRNETPSSHEITDVGIWDRSANLEAWEWYLGGEDADGYAAPARMEDVSGLPPTFIDVGEMDLFRDEDLAFATRLMQAGVPVELHVYPGAYHASETFAPEVPLSQTIRGNRIEALRRALHG